MLSYSFLKCVCVGGGRGASTCMCDCVCPKVGVEVCLSQFIGVHLKFVCAIKGG